MMRGFKALVTVGLALMASICVAQRGQVKILAPENDSVVRGIVEFVADKPNAQDGTYAWKVTRTGGDQDEFSGNTVAGRPFPVDTRVRDENGLRYYPDGEYTVSVNGFDGDGELQGNAEVKFRIENDIPAADVADGVELKILLKTNDELGYEFNAEETIVIDTSPENLDELLKDYDEAGKKAWRDYYFKNNRFAFESKLWGNYQLKMLSGSGDGAGGLSRQTCMEGVVLPYPGTQPQWIEDNAKTFTQQYEGNGPIGPHKGDGEHFELGELFIKLPGKKLTLTTRPWKSDMGVVLAVSGLHHQIVTAENRVDGFEWLEGKRCARIVSTWSEEHADLEATVGGSPMAFKGTLSGTRVTHFAYEDGYPVSIVDTMHHAGVIEPKQQQMGGMGGMGEAGGMGGGMGEPGMMGGGMPGMMGGGQPGMMGGGMPGMMGGGQPGMMGGGMPGMMGGGTGQPGMMGGGMPGMMGGAQPGMMGGGMPGMMGGGEPGMMGGGMPGMMGGGMPGMMGGGMPGMMGGGMGEAGMGGGMPGMMGGGMGEAGMGGMGGMGGTQPATPLRVTADIELSVALKS